MEARDALNEGVEAFQGGRYDEATAKFEKAVELDPCLTNARAFLGVALAQDVVPGLDTPENLKVAQRAIDIFKVVLAQSPHDINSMKQLAGVYYNVKRFEDAKEWQRQVMVEDPNDAEAACTIGVIDWTLAHQNALQELTTAGLSDDGEGNLHAPPAVLRAIQLKNGTLVPEAIEYLERAIEIRPKYDDAMQYLNLVYRRKADLDRDSAATLKNDLVQANAWSAKAMETRKANAYISAKGQTASQPQPPRVP